MWTCKALDVHMIATVVNEIKSGADAKACIRMLREPYRNVDVEPNLGSIATQMTGIRKRLLAEGHPVPEGFSLTREETKQLKKQRLTAKMARQDETLVIPDIERLLMRATHLLENATHAISMSRLILGLALVSGRRCTELTNGRSKFLPVIGRPYHAEFHGQLKQREPQPYVIPLLVPHTLFIHCLDILREKQGDVSGLTNEECKSRFVANANAALKRGELAGMPTCAHVHSLRAVYAKLVHHMWSSPWEVNRLAQRVLGHVFVEESIAYVGSVTLRGGDALRGTWGRLELPDVAEE